MMYGRGWPRVNNVPDAAGRAVRWAGLLIAGTGVQGGALFTGPALLTPPFGAERTVRLSSNGFSCRNACLNENASTSEKAYFRAKPASAVKAFQCTRSSK